MWPVVSRTHSPHVSHLLSRRRPTQRIFVPNIIHVGQRGAVSNSASQPAAGWSARTVTASAKLPGASATGMPRPRPQCIWRADKTLLIPEPPVRATCGCAPPALSPSPPTGTEGPSPAALASGGSTRTRLAESATVRESERPRGIRPGGSSTSPTCTVPPDAATAIGTSPPAAPGPRPNNSAPAAVPAKGPVPCRASASP